MPDEFKLRLEDELEVIMSCYEEENVHITSKGPVTLVTVYLPGPDFKADMPSYLPISATVHLPPMYMQQTTPAPLCTFSYRAMTNPVSPLVPLLDGWLGEEREREARVQLVSFYTAAGPTGGEVLFDFFEWVRQWLPYPSESLRSETAVAKQEGASPPAATAAATSASAVAPAAIAAPRPPSWKELWTAGGVFIGPKELIQKSRFAVFVVPVQTAQEAKRAVALLLQNPDLGAATHNMWAYRLVSESGMETLDADEDGEAGAESPMLFVTRAIKVSNALVMVSRWFGGVLLGPSRFAIIKDMLSRGYKAYRASVEAGTYVAP